MSYWLPQRLSVMSVVFSTRVYWAQREGCIAREGPQIAIEWPIAFEPALSAKGQLGRGPCWVEGAWGA